MFNFIRNLFRYKAKSAEEFVEVMRKEGCRTVVVQPYVSAEDLTPDSSVGLALFQYMMKFMATTPRGRKVVYRECFFTCFDSPFFEDVNNKRNAASLKLFLLSEQKAKELQAKLPGVSVSLIGPNSCLMDDAMSAKLHKDAADYNVSI